MVHQTPPTTAEAALERAISIVGSRAELARRLGISRPAVAQWTQVPIKRAADVSRITGIPIDELCPELATSKADSKTGREAIEEVASPFPSEAAE